MNLVGKIFVVLILVMSLVFMGFAVAVFATHKSWKNAVESTEPPGLKLQLQNAQARNKELSDQIRVLKEESAKIDADARTRATGLQNELATMTQLRDNLQNDNAALKQGERQAVQEAQNAQMMLDAKLAEIDKLRTDIFEAYKQRDEKFKSAVDMQDKLIEAENELERLKGYKLTLLTQIAQYKQAAAKQGIDISKPADYIPPKLDGIVLASRSNGLVELSLGSDDGLEPGQEAYIWRKHSGQDKFIAKIEIVETRPDRSVGKVIPSYKKGPIERDDRVVTKLP